MEPMSTTPQRRHDVRKCTPARLAAVFACLLAVALAMAGSGCSKKGAPITGSASAPPVSLQCAWQPGYTYQVRFEMDTTTDIEPPDPTGNNLHRVTFHQVCLINVTNAASNMLRLDLEVVSLGMERSKANLVSTGFDSEQGGETFDDSGFVPVLRRLVGGKMRFLLAADGRVMKTDGLSEWLERALGSQANTPRVKRVVSSLPTRILTTTTNADGSITTNITVTAAAAPAAPASAAAASTPAVRSAVASALRNFFTQDLFKQLLEFQFLPTVPVRVGDHWQVQGDTPFSIRGRPRYTADVKFVGWQNHLGTNCARLDVDGTIAQRASRTAKRDGTLDATIWIDTGSRFPLASVLSKEAAFPSNSTSRNPDTNEVANAAAPKRMRQQVTIQLLSMQPTAEIPPATAP